jgi:hypothetical protein
MPIEYRSGGRKVSRDQWFQGLADEAVAGPLREVQKTLEGVTCPDHGKRPVVTMERTADGASFHIEGCCEKLVEKAQRAAGGSR